MATKTVILPKSAPKPLGPYSHAIRTGDLLFLAGQIPLDPSTNAIAGPDIATQTERVLLNIQGILSDQGLSLRHVVKSTVFMTDLGEFAAMNEVYAKYFDADPPARSTIQVAALPRGSKIEIEVVAHC
jgi:2-iminobutanoate/2-iminopropanoate deaminase